MIRSHLLVREGATREHSICICNLVSPAANVLCFEVGIKSLDDVPTAMSGSFGEIIPFEVIYLNFQLRLRRKKIASV